MSRSHSHLAHGPEVGVSHHRSLPHARMQRQTDHPFRTARHSPSNPPAHSSMHKPLHHHTHHSHHSHQSYHSRRHMASPVPPVPVSAPVAPSARPVGVYSTAGRPVYQHDRYLIHHARDVSLYAVADGHGSADHGHLTSQHLVDSLTSTFSGAGLLSLPLPADIKTAAKKPLAQLDSAVIRATASRRVYAGSTMCAVLQVGQSVHCINVGDSRAILVSISPSRRSTPLSRDHTCTDPAERRRIERAGGVIVGGLLNGYISMSRAFGDDDLKSHRDITSYPVAGTRPYGADMFISDPDTSSTALTDDDVAVVIASDGVWGKVSNDQVANIVLQELARGTDPEGIARAISKKALGRGSNDNVTAVVALTGDLQSVRNRVAQSSGSRRRFRMPLKAEGSESEAAANENSTTTTANESCSTLDSSSAEDSSSGRHGRRLRFGRRERMQSQLGDPGRSTGRAEGSGRSEDKFAFRLWSNLN